MDHYLKIAISSLIIATFLTGCGDGGSFGNNPPVVNDPPPPTLSSDASLSNLTVSTGSFNEVFDSGTYAYTQNTGASELSVTPSLSDANASVTVNGVAVASGSASSQIALALGLNTITVIVTAEDGSTTQSYTVDVTRLSSDASLSGLSLSAGDLDQIFQSTLYDYTATVGYTQASVMVTAQTTNAGASLTTNGTAVSSGQPSEEIPLAEGLNTITVAVTAEDGVTIQNYILNLTRQSANNFAQQAYVKASNTGASDLFGSAVAISGDTLVVGASGEASSATGIGGNQADNSAASAGAVYVFTRDGAGLWSQQAYIKASNTQADDRFGASVTLSGDTLAVGAIGEDSATTGVGGNQADNSAASAGAVYVFTRDGAGLWSQQAYIKASNSQADDQFGRSVAISGDTLAVGVEQEDSSATGINGDQTDNSATNSGAAYVFARDGAGMWSQQAYIKASNSGANDWFGTLALSGDTLVVGARGEDSAATGLNGDQSGNSVLEAGAVYVFTRDGGGLWSQQAYVKSFNTDVNDWFGYSVALSGDTLAVGAFLESSAAMGVNGNGADNRSTFSGAAYVFTRNGLGQWSQQAYVKASNTQADDRFGYSVAISGDTLAVGALFESSAATGINGNQADNSVIRAGAVYVFTRDGAGAWSQQSYVKASNPEADDRASFVALSGDTLAVGAGPEDSSATGINGDETNNNAVISGAVYVFQ